MQKKLLHLIRNTAALTFYMISQVCGLKWSHDDRELASGGNDNQVTKSVHIH